MPAMNFKGRFIDPILSGEKRQTLRKSTGLKPGDEVDCYCRWGQPPFARLKVTSVDRVRRLDLRAADAHADGFATKREMLDFIDATYGVALRLYRIKFEVIS